MSDLRDLRHHGALLRSRVPRDDFFSNPNIFAIVSDLQNKLNIDVTGSRDFINEVVELMDCIHKSQPNWDKNLKELNRMVVSNVVQNVQCDNKISKYPQEAETAITRKPPNYLYDVKFIPKKVFKTNFGVDPSSDYSQGDYPATIDSTSMATLNDTAALINPSLHEDSTAIEANTKFYEQAVQTRNYREFYLHVDSRDRDVAADPSPSNYKIDLLPSSAKTAGFIPNLDQTHLKDIIEVRLVEVLMPNVFINSPPGYNQNYFFININEFDGDFYATSASGLRLFGKLRFEQENAPSLSFLNLETSSCVKKWRYTDPTGRYQNNQTPLAKLDRLSISILDYDGKPFNFGEDLLKIASITAIGTQSEIETVTDHNLSTNDLIYIKNSNNVDLNRTEGYFVAGITSSTKFIIDFDTTGLGALPDVSEACVLIAKFQHSMTFFIRAIGGI